MHNETYTDDSLFQFVRLGVGLHRNARAGLKGVD